MNFRLFSRPNSTYYYTAWIPTQFMSDIPLHIIRRQNPPERSGFFSYNDSMPKSRRTRNRNRDQRDDSDEEAGLLDTQYGEKDEYEELRLSRVMSPVCCLLRFHISFFGTVRRNTSSGNFFEYPAKDSSRTILFNPSSRRLSALFISL